jgi:hypothetical protein
VVLTATAGCASQGVTPTAQPTGAATSSLTSAPPSTGSASPSDASSSTSDAAGLPTTDPDTATSSATGKVYKVTDTVTEGGFKIKIHSITLPYTPPAGSFFTPPETKAWLLLDFEVTEVSPQPEMFSTLGAFDLRDNQNTAYIISVADEQSLPAGQVFPEHEMKPGETSRGKVIFEINQNAKGLRLTFKGNMWHASQTPPIIDLGR